MIITYGWAVRNINEGRSLGAIHEEMKKITRLLNANNDEIRTVEQSRAPVIDSTGKMIFF
jgi:hypothetical protein